jgi:hypothetical protein
MNKLSPIISIKNHIEVEGKESSFLLILCDRPVGGSSVGRAFVDLFEERIQV